MTSVDLWPDQARSQQAREDPTSQEQAGGALTQLMEVQAVRVVAGNSLEEGVAKLGGTKARLDCSACRRHIASVQVSNRTWSGGSGPNPGRQHLDSFSWAGPYHLSSKQAEHTGGQRCATASACHTGKHMWGQGRTCPDSPMHCLDASPGILRPLERHVSAASGPIAQRCSPIWAPSVAADLLDLLAEVAKVLWLRHRLLIADLQVQPHHVHQVALHHPCVLQGGTSGTELCFHSDLSCAESHPWFPRRASGDEAQKRGLLSADANLPALSNMPQKCCPCKNSAGRNASGGQQHPDIIHR